MKSNQEILAECLKAALLEDAPEGDITTQLFVPAKSMSTAEIITREDGVFFGTWIVESIFKVINSPVEIKFFILDGENFKAQDKICSLKGSTQAILLVERVLLNFLQRLSGIATITKRFVDKVGDRKIQILNTRKTTPLMRFLELEAVKAGGGVNHRFGLSDMVLIKENHLAYLKNEKEEAKFGEIIRKFKAKNPGKKVELEITSLDQVEQYDMSNIDYLMLDNFCYEDIPPAVVKIKQINPQIQIEISGSINLTNLEKYLDLGLDRISIGALTHSVKACDFSLLFVEEDR